MQTERKFFSRVEYKIAAQEFGLLFIDEEFKDVLKPGTHTFYDPKNKVYISRDHDNHGGGALKIAKDIKDIDSRERRMGTYTPDMVKLNFCKTTFDAGKPGVGVA